MLRILEQGNSMPFQWPVDPSAIFESGAAASLTVIGSQIMATTSNGMGFIGVFDDVKNQSFTAVSWDEEIIVTPSASNLTVNGSSQISIISEVRAELENPNVDGNYFISSPVEVELIPRNGVIVFPAGTVLNYNLAGGDDMDSIRTIVRYPYQIPNVIGTDTTFASQRVTVWFQKMIFETDQFEVNQEYMVMSNLFINERGLFTTRQILPNSPIVAICTAPPSMINPNIQAMLL